MSTAVTHGPFGPSIGYLADCGQSTAGDSRFKSQPRAIHREPAEIVSITRHS
jgi:hypothetical protein